MANFYTYTPENLIELIESKNENLDIWLDERLKKEIELSKPTDADIGFAGKRSVQRLAEECAKLLPPDRIFCGKQQLLAVVKAFALHWAFAISSCGKSYKCCCGPANKKKSPKVSPPRKRKVKDSMKKEECPFVIKY
jgi:hypothetical protein